MATINEFKNFVKENPKLTKYVKDGSMSWQKFYELYDLYGGENEVWDTYLKTQVEKTTNFNLSDTLNFFKNIDLDSLQNGINSIQRVVGVVSDLSVGKEKTNESNKEYKPRPLYKNFED